MCCFLTGGLAVDGDETVLDEPGEERGLEAFARFLFWVSSMRLARLLVTGLKSDSIDRLSGGSSGGEDSVA